MTATISSAQRSAASKVQQALDGRIRAAWVNGGPSAATPRGNDRYLVISRDGRTRYTVHVLSAEHATCDCPSGIHRGRDGQVSCWHSAAALLRRLADSALTAEVL